jgi:hypothetical protein
MRRIADSEMRQAFLGWQCRIRQMSMRDYGGRPLAGMMPRVALRSGEVLLPAMITLLIPHDPGPSTSFLRFQVQKTPDPQRSREAGVAYLGADFYQLPELFSDELTAVFQPGSTTAASILSAREILLDFTQYNQSFRMFCRVRRLRSAEEAREASLWQARIFNRSLANEVIVLGFRPDWKNAHADPPV